MRLEGAVTGIAEFVLGVEMPLELGAVDAAPGLFSGAGGCGLLK